MEAMPSSPMGGGVVSVELNSSRISEMPEAVGEAEDRSDSPEPPASEGAAGSWFMVMRTVAASRSWTC